MTYAGQLTWATVHAQMMLQIARDYTAIPNVFELTASEIRWFYDALRDELKSRK